MQVIRFLVIFLIFFLTSLPSEAIKIGLIDATPYSYIGTSTEGYLIDTKTNKSLYRIEPMKPYKFSVRRNSIIVEVNSKEYNLGTDIIQVRPVDNGLCCAKKRWYRGELILRTNGSKLTVINNLQLEDYIRGVVPSEMPSKWNIEALKAQAIAARSYALANLNKRGSLGYDLKDTPEDQAYGGASSETPESNKACDDTRWIVLTYDKKVIPAYYSASAGGHTTNSGDVWMKDLPYLRAVPSYDGNVKKNGHGIGMSQHGANNLAGKGYNAYQILTYFYNNVKFGKVPSTWPI